MAITLDGIDLPDQLIWIDELNWSPVTQKIDKSLSGALIIQEAAQIKGQPITLAGGHNSNWITRATLNLLKTKVNTPDLEMTLSFHGTDYTVKFARSANKSPIESKEIRETSEPDDDHFYSFIIFLMEV